MELASTINRRASSRGVRFHFFARARRIEVPQSSPNFNPTMRARFSVPPLRVGLDKEVQSRGLLNQRDAAEPRTDAPACLNLPYSNIKALAKLLGRRASPPNRALK